MSDEIAALAYIRSLAQLSLAKRGEVDSVVHENFKQVLQGALKKCDFYKGKRHPFPLLTKEEVRSNIHTGLISNEHLGHPCLVVEKTSGSTDEAVSFAYLMGFHRHARMVFPFMINTDWKWGENYCVLSTVHCSKDRCSTENMSEYVRRVKVPTSDDIFTDQDVLERAVAVLKNNQGSLVHADPLYLCAMAAYCDRKDIRLSFKGISSTYELLTPNIKRYLEKIFSCKVFDSYGCSEFGPIAFACQHGAKHIFEGSVFVEIIDKGRYLDPEVGEIVVTALDNPAMPLIRYRTGDVGKLIEDTCACKRTAKRMGIYGRASQSVSFQGILYSERDIAGLMDVPGVLVYQLSQNHNDLTFNILLEQRYAGNDRQQEIWSEIIARFRKLGAVGISVVFVNELRPENSGKFKSVTRATLHAPVC